MDQARQELYLREMEISSWQVRMPAADPVEPPSAAAPVVLPEAVKDSGAKTKAQSLPEVVPVEPQPTADIDTADWPVLEAAVTACKRCALHSSRSRAVFGVGSQQAELMVIGEAPGADEDAQGEPFVGRAGQLLNEMLSAIGLPRQQVYITNMLKSRPPNNRNPQEAEIKACMPYLQRQIALVKPKVIICVGRVAASTLLERDESLSQLRLEQHQLPGTSIPLRVTYHPAYLLRSPSDKAKAWADMKLLRQLLVATD